MSLKGLLRISVLGVVLLMATLFGVPMRPQDIEELLHAHRQIKVEESSQDEERDLSEDEKKLQQRKDG